ncbi:MAG: 23S rRNA (uracil(1939)-C(5))-methyltransferase RlmD [Oscillospiraceae bacterium]|nr:23S rRNA (uracil(1939)-C(5))-methyltransferase RlmD [Oscillospiraceae bacterium]
MLKKNEIYTGTIIDISSDSNGVCKIEGFPVFIPLTVPGDVIDFKVVKVLKNYAFGIIDKIITPSPDRIDDDCAVYKTCGGCSFRNMTYERELQVKDNIVKNAFKRLGGIDTEFEEILGSEKTDAYRNKAQYPLATQNGEIIYGFYAKRSHRVIGCGACNLQPPIFSQIADSVVEFLKEHNIKVYDEQTQKGLVRHIYLRYGEKTGQIMLCLVCTKSTIPFCDEFVAQITQKFPQITSIVINVNSKNTNVIMGEKCKTIYGEDVIFDILCKNKIEISPLSFYQVNASQAQRLYWIAREYASLEKDMTILDFYCGAGTIGLSMARDVKSVIGVEIVAPAIENAKKNAKLNLIDNAEFICADASVASKQLAEKGITPDVVFVDPPRKGCDEVVIDSIVKMAPNKVVMISCNPATAARDCKLFEEKGYKVVKARAVDMFPRTSHVECCVLLCRE